MSINKEQQFILDLVSYVLFDNRIINDTNFDYAYIKNKVKEQKMDVMVYQALNKLNIDNDYSNYLANRYLKLLVYSYNQENEYQEIIKLFNKNNLDYVPLKGTFTKHYYPEMDYRLMGDIDILVHNEELDKIDKILKANNYIKEDSSCAHHLIYDHGQYGHFEIHFSLFDLEEKKYLDKIAWEETSNHKFTNEFNIAYLCAHYAKHFSHGGASFKSLIDIGLMMLQENIDYDKLKDILLNAKQYDFYNHIMQLFNYVFNQKVYVYENELNNEELDKLINYLFLCGDFGFGKENDHNKISAINDLSKKKNNKWNRFIYKVKKVCLPYKHFKYKSKLIRYVPILLPFAWLARLFSFIFIRRKDMKDRLQSINSVSSNDIANYEIVSKMLGDNSER